MKKIAFTSLRIILISFSLLLVFAALPYLTGTKAEANLTYVYNNIFTGQLRTVPVGTQTSIWQTVIPGRICNYCHYGRLYIENPSVNVQYGVQVLDAATGAVIPNGSTVTKGTEVQLRFMPHRSDDIYWFGTGRFISSPYGDWVTSQKLGSNATVNRVPREAGGTLGNICTDKNRVYRIDQAGGSDLMYSSLSINAPVKELSIPSGWQCTPVAGSGGSPVTDEIGFLNGGGYNCTLDRVGTFEPTFNFEQTQGHFYTNRSWQGSCGGAPYLTTAAAAIGASNVIWFQIPEFYLTVTKNSVAYSVRVPAQNVSAESESLNIPAQTLQNGSRTESLAATELTITALGNAMYVPSQSLTGGFLVTPRQVPLSTASDGGGQLGGGMISTVTVPERTIPYSITVGEAEPPNTPTVEIVGSCRVGSPHTISFTATDPNNESLRYGIDWDNDGSVDQFVPATAGQYVPSGVTQTASRTYSQAGTYTVGVLATNQSGASSAYAKATFSCSDVPLPPRGQINANPTQVDRGNPTEVTWSSRNTDFCRVTSLPFAGEWKTTSGREDSDDLDRRTVFTLSCRSRIDQQMVELGEAIVRINPDDDEPPGQCVDPVISVNTPLVYVGEEVLLTWDTNTCEPSSCVLRGPGVMAGQITDQTGELSVTIKGDSRFYLICNGGGDGDGDGERIQAEVPVRALIRVQET